MLRNRSLPLLIALLALVILAACANLNGKLTLPRQHMTAADLGQKPKTCTECHETQKDSLAYERFNHTPLFGENHRQVAYQSEQVCSICHQPSFCNDCHATRVELKPSLKNQSETFRQMPHRGDYRSRHQIDGRVDPTSCFRCHGNPKSSTTCTPCHG